MSLLSFGQKNIDNFWGVDNFKAKYVSYENTIYKKGTKLKEYTFTNYGTPTSIDITNPLKILVYFKDYNQVLVLDNQLNPIEEVAVPFSTQNICYASNNKIWLYNSISNQLELYNIKTETIEVKSLPINSSIVKLKSGINTIYTLSTDNTITTYNYLGRKVNQQSTNNSIVDFHFYNNNLYVQNNKGLYQNQQIISLKGHTQIWANDTQIYAFDGKKITNFDIP